jgi:carboxypeptidase family protein/TonB-dependent receptor-like protein
MQKLNTVGAFLLAVIFLTTCSVAFGQETTGSIEGSVKDTAGALVPNVTLTVTNAKAAASATTTTGMGSAFKRTITSDDEGSFRILQVPPGTYDVVASPSSGFGEARYENVTVAIGQATQLAITVTPGNNVTRVDIIATEALPLDISNNAIQTTISAERMQLIPKGAGFTGLLKAVPGTRPESRTGGFSVDGASGGENVFVIDGQEVTNYRTGTLNETYNIPTQLVQEVQVKSSGFDALYGGATGGVISVVTRGGGNDFHGEFGMQWEVPKFNGPSRKLLQRFTSADNLVQSTTYFQPNKPSGVNTFPTATLSGPVFKDRLWFFGSYTPQIFETFVDTPYYTNTLNAQTLTTVERYSRTRKYEYAFGRLDANPFNDLRLSGTFLWNPVIDRGSLPTTSFTNNNSALIGIDNVPTADYKGNIGVLRGNQYTNLQGGRQTSNLASFSAVYTPKSNIVIEGRYSRGFLNEKNGNYFIPLLTPRIVTCPPLSTKPLFPCDTTGVNTITVKDISIRTSYDFSAAYIFNAGGQHEFRSGYQRFSIFNDVQQGNNAIGELRFTFGQLISSQVPGLTNTPGAIGYGNFRRQGTNGKGSNLSQGVFVQDKYQPTSRLTLNLGVRFEKENLPTFNQFPSLINFGWGDKIAPRLGFAYDLTGKGNTKIFASYGRFFDRVKFALPRGLFGGDIFLDDYFEIFPGETASQFNIGNVIGSFTGPSVCPTSGFIIAGVRSRCQLNRRVNANDPTATATNGGGAVDPDLRPFRQTEFTVGAERQVSRDYVFRARYTYKNVDEAVEDAGVRNSQDSESYIIGNPGRGLHLATLQALGYTKSTRPQRRYDGVEFVLDKRLSNNWYANVNYTYSRLFGNYSGLTSSDEPHLIDGRLSPGVSRAFDLPHIGFNAKGEKDNGRLQTDRPHVFNIYGAYILDWKNNRVHSSEFSAFQTITSGQPQTTTIYGASSITPQILLERGDLGRSPTYSQTDFSFTHRYRWGTDQRFTMAFDLNMLNLWDQKTVTAIYTVMNPSTAVVNGPALGFPNTTTGYSNGYADGSLLDAILARIASRGDRSDIRYKLPYLYQSPRTVRFGFRILF